MIFEIKWRTPAGIDYQKLTTNIETVYKTYDMVIENTKELGVGIGVVPLYISLRDEDSGDIFQTYVGRVPRDDNADFVRWLADYAKKDKRVETINWVTDAISKYDASNPTIKSLIYSLWGKARRGTDQTE